MYKIYVIKSIDIIYKLPFKSTIYTTTVYFLWIHIYLAKMHSIYYKLQQKCCNAILFFQINTVGFLLNFLFIKD